MMKLKTNKSGKGQKERKKDKGDKKVSQPFNSSRIMKSRVANISASGRDIRIKHREYLKEVVVAADAIAGRPTLTYVEVNPGLYSCFPWLSGLANQFESYTFHSLSLHYVPSCSSATVGSIIMAPDFDVSDYEPDSLITLQTFPGSVRTSAWAETRMNCPPDLLTKLVKERMIRNGEVGDVDLKLYDTCCIYIANIGFIGLAASVGSLWIEYDVTLRTPSVDTTVESADSAQMWSDGPSGCTKAGILGTPGQTVLKQDAYQPIVSQTGATTLHFDRPGQYLMEFIIGGTGLVNTDLPALSAVAGEVIFGAISGIANAAGTAAWYQTVMNVLTPGTITFLANAAWTTVATLNLKLAPYRKSYGL